MTVPPPQLGFTDELEELALAVDEVLIGRQVHSSDEFTDLEVVVGNPLNARSLPVGTCPCR